MEEVLKNLVAMTARAASGSQTPTVIPRVTIWFSPCKTGPTPAMFEPKFYLLLQGAKRISIGSRSLDMGPGSYAVSSVGVPFSGQVTEASPEKPYLGVELKLDAGVLASLLLEMPEQDMPEGDGPSMPAVATSAATDEIIEPLHRLLRLLSSPKDIPALAPLIERELYYRVLQGALGNVLRQAGQAHSRFSQIKRTVEWICSNATRAMSVKELAASVGMSMTSFHRHFKAVTGLSPLVYQRQVRLLDARRLLNSEKTSVTEVALAVGYASSSQFSREYSRMFGCPPMRDTLRVRRAPRPTQ